ncbi:type II toxin-antitoxin system HicA family toxin, partial [Jeotgalibaca arthritidis]
QDGSHLTMRNENTKKQTVVPMHNQDLARGTEHAILKQAGLK